MRRYVFQLSPKTNDLNLYTFDDNNHLESVLINQEVIEKFDEILTEDNKNSFKVTTAGAHRLFEGNDYLVRFNNYKGIIRRINILKKNPSVKTLSTNTKRVVGIAAATTGLIGMLAISILNYNKNYDAKMEAIKNKITVEKITDEEMQEYLTSLENLTEEQEEITKIYVDTESRYSEELDSNIKEYESIINEVSEKRGVDPRIMYEIIQQESRGGKLERKSEINFDQWLDQELKVYNFIENKYETVVLTNNPNKHPTADIIITKNDLKNPYTDIAVGTILFKYGYDNYCNHNLPLAITTYNNGIGAVKRILKETSINENISVDDIINDESYTDFMKYTYAKNNNADANYFYNVISHSSPTCNLEDGKKYTMKYIEDGRVVTKTVLMQSTKEKLLASK